MVNNISDSHFDLLINIFDVSNDIHSLSRKVPKILKSNTVNRMIMVSSIQEYKKYETKLLYDIKNIEKKIWKNK